MIVGFSFIRALFRKTIVKKMMIEYMNTDMISPEIE
jgi:hypothetical protein